MSQEDLIEASHFLLDHPPLDEIGGSIMDVIESYRYKTITKKQAEQQMLTEHYPYLSRYVKDRDLILI
jgi:hypothetical protein